MNNDKEKYGLQKDNLRILKEAIKNKGMTYSKLANETNINKRTIEKYFDGTRKPKKNDAIRIASVLGISVGILLPPISVPTIVGGIGLTIGVMIGGLIRNLKYDKNSEMNKNEIEDLKREISTLSVEEKESLIEIIRESTSNVWNYMPDQKTLITWRHVHNFT